MVHVCEHLGMLVNIPQLVGVATKMEDSDLATQELSATE